MGQIKIGRFVAFLSNAVVKIKLWMLAVDQITE